jgi:tetratricopeptide (TPR) repeat protein
LLACSPLLAGLALFFVLFDWLQDDAANSDKLILALGIFFAVTALASLTLWANDLTQRAPGEIFSARNPYPLGHSNYTAGLALLALPWFGRLGLRASRPASYAWAAAIALALAMLFTSASRGGLLGLAALTLGALAIAPLDRSRKIYLGVGLVFIGLAIALANPRTRAMFSPTPPDAELSQSNLQRSAMLTAGWRMGLDRPLLGWGPGATPLVYPNYRAGLEGGVENVLQLHSTPVQLWAELGAPAVISALGFIGLVMLNLRREPSAGLALLGYGAFALTDWQLDVPIFSLAVAACAALLAAPSEGSTRPGRIAGFSALAALALVVLLGHRDPAPELNVRALALARDPAKTEQAITLLRESLALNPDQEIAHFNLGWLLVVRSPAEAEKHFRAAAQLVPDKGGVYFGLGLARLNQPQSVGAARAFAVECLNDPAFLASPWWREAPVAAQRDATRAEFARLAALAKTLLPPHSWIGRQLDEVAVLAPTLGVVPAGDERTYFRERTGYPVLMRNLDLPTPVDLYPVRELVPDPKVVQYQSVVAPPLPPKGWLPSTLLLRLLDAAVALDQK